MASNKPEASDCKELADEDLFEVRAKSPLGGAIGDRARTCVGDLLPTLIFSSIYSIDYSIETAFSVAEIIAV